jgi:hypothetical protein
MEELKALEKSLTTSFTKDNSKMISTTDSEDSSTPTETITSATGKWVRDPEEVNSLT